MSLYRPMNLFERPTMEEWAAFLEARAAYARQLFKEQNPDIDFDKLERPAGNINGCNTVFQLSRPPKDPRKVRLFLNQCEELGQGSGAECFQVNGTEIRMTTSPLTLSELHVSYE